MFRNILTGCLGLLIWFDSALDLTAGESGWGLIVNRTTGVVTLDITDSDGRVSAWDVLPSRAIKLRKCTSYTVRIRNTDFATTIDAQPLRLEVPTDASSVMMPKWEAMSLPNDSVTRT